MGYQLTGMYIRPNGVEKQIRPTGWQPGANTVAYYPLTSDFNDASGNSRNLTNSGATITTLSGISCAYFDGSSYSEYSGFSLGRSARTVCAWCNVSNTASYKCIVHISNNSWQYPTGSLGLLLNGTTVIVSDWESNFNTGTFTPSQWCLIVVTQEGNNEVLYINGTQVSNEINYPSEVYTPDGWGIGAKYYSNRSEKLTGYLSSIILEDKARTAQEISDYYNLTKGNYGIS